MNRFFPFSGRGLFHGTLAALLNSTILLAQVACTLLLVKWILL